MPAPSLPATISLQTVREELIFTDARCTADPNAKDLAAPIRKMLAAWSSVNDAQLALWDAQTRADALISAADDGLDAFADDFSGALLATVNQKRNDPRYTLYFKVAPSELKRPILGGQLETMRGWSKNLAKEKAPALTPFVATLTSALKIAGDAVKARRDADAENDAFRKTGGLATYLTEVESVRDALYLALDSRRLERSLARAWAGEFFRKKQPGKPTDADKAAKDAKRAAKKAQADAVAAAKAQVKAAQKTLQSLKKPKKG